MDDGARWDRTARCARRGAPPAAPRAVAVVLVLVAIAIIAIGQQWASAPRGALPVGDSALFLFLNALNVFLVFLLIYLVARNLVKLVFERRRGALGSHLNLKFVLAFA